jgi:hypothetical protein
VTDEFLTIRTVVALLLKGVERAFTSRTVVALRRGHRDLLVGRLSSVARLSLPTQLSESKPAAYVDNPAALPSKSNQKSS